MEKNEDNSYLQLSPKTSLAGEFITKSDLAFLNVFSRCSTYKRTNEISLYMDTQTQNNYKCNYSQNYNNASIKKYRFSMI